MCSDNKSKKGHCNECGKKIIGESREIDTAPTKEDELCEQCFEVLMTILEI